jgi:hypothetical protein
LYDQCRILCHIFKANYEGEKIAASDSISSEDLKFMHRVKKMIPALNRLKRTGYLDDDEDLQLTRDGHLTTETLFRKFLLL